MLSGEISNKFARDDEARSEDVGSETTPRRPDFHFPKREQEEEEEAARIRGRGRPTIGNLEFSRAETTPMLPPASLITFSAAVYR